jgi:peroxiredoxin
MKKMIILGCIGAAFIFLIGATAILFKKKHDFRQTITDLPSFCLLRALDNMPFCSTQLVKDKSVVLMYLHPECDICHIESQQMLHKMEKMNNIQWILVSFAEKNSLNQFALTYQLNTIPDLTILMDTKFELHYRLQVKSIPSCYIYDRQHQLVKTIRGMTKLETIIQLAKRDND